MKKLTITSICAIALLSACANKTQQTQSTDNNDNIIAPADSADIMKSNSIGNIAKKVFDAQGIPESSCQISYDSSTQMKYIKTDEGTEAYISCYLQENGNWYVVKIVNESYDEGPVGYVESYIFDGQTLSQPKNPIENINHNTKLEPTFSENKINIKIYVDTENEGDIEMIWNNGNFEITYNYDSAEGDNYDGDLSNTEAMLYDFCNALLDKNVINKKTFKDFSVNNLREYITNEGLRVSYYDSDFRNDETIRTFFDVQLYCNTDNFEYFVIYFSGKARYDETNEELKNYLDTELKVFVMDGQNVFESKAYLPTIEEILSAMNQDVTKKNDCTISYILSEDSKLEITLKGAINEENIEGEFNGTKFELSFG